MKWMCKLLFVALSFMVMISCQSKQDSPEAVVDNYLSLLKKNQVEDAVNLVYFKDSLSEKDKEEIVELYKTKVSEAEKEDGKVASYEIKEAQIEEDGNSGVVKYIVRFEDGKTKDNSEGVIKVNGKWYVKSGK